MVRILGVDDGQVKLFVSRTWAFGPVRGFYSINGPLPGFSTVIGLKETFLFHPDVDLVVVQRIHGQRPVGSLRLGVGGAIQ